MISESVVPYMTSSLYFLKLHPLAMVNLLIGSFSNIYNRNEDEAFQNHEQVFVDWLKFAKGSIFFDYKGLSVKLDTEYKGRMLRDIIRHLAMAHASEHEQGSSEFPSRLVDSKTLELLRTEVLADNDV